LLFLGRTQRWHVQIRYEAMWNHTFKKPLFIAIGRTH
jgi:hypothetical protein